jgi:uncharacterized protein YjbJ (UPF0337 family)
MGLGSFFKNLFGSAKEKAGEIADKTENFVEESYEKAKETAAPIIDKVENFAEETMDKAKEKIEEYVPAAKEKLKML